MTDEEKQQGNNILGLQTDELAGLTAEELAQNQTAINMLYTITVNLLMIIHL